jgi:hypothetical protein
MLHVQQPGTAMAELSKQKSSIAVDGSNFTPQEMGTQENTSSSGGYSRRRTQTEQAERRRKAKRSLRHHLEDVLEENRRLKQELEAVYGTLEQVGHDAMLISQKLWDRIVMQNGPGILPLSA